MIPFVNFRYISLNQEITSREISESLVLRATHIYETEWHTDL